MKLAHEIVKLLESNDQLASSVHSLIEHEKVGNNLSPFHKTFPEHEKEVTPDIRELFQTYTLEEIITEYNRTQKP